jgi:hypothetical protein
MIPGQPRPAHFVKVADAPPEKAKKPEAFASGLKKRVSAYQGRA